ncbi:8569_t:CDS:2 [Paraglomus occultum]|uniref:8569_t:CDS:1 n=1 Tax=Paraglomus occultum TaxID=144539 RepID=A0A9N8W3X8_9GLOM|nr:8569_t:CDS:2 [Paraglomus occultum]
MNLQFLPCLSRDLGRLLLDTDTSDVIIRVRQDNVDEDGDEECVFRAHSQIIRARCKKLGELMDKERSTKGGIDKVVITLSDMTSKTFRVLLEYIYTGKLAIINFSPSEVISLLITASAYSLFDILSYIQTQLISQTAAWISQNSLDLYLRFHNDTSFEELAMHCKQVMRKSPELAMKDEKFIKMEKESVIELVQWAERKMEAVEIWESVLNWGKAQANIEEADYDKWTLEEKERIAEILEDVLVRVRFSQMSSTDIHSKVMPANLRKRDSADQGKKRDLKNIETRLHDDENELRKSFDDSYKEKAKDNRVEGIIVMPGAAVIRPVNDPSSAVNNTNASPTVTPTRSISSQFQVSPPASPSSTTFPTLSKNKIFPLIQTISTYNIFSTKPQRTLRTPPISPTRKHFTSLPPPVSSTLINDHHTGWISACIDYLNVTQGEEHTMYNRENNPYKYELLLRGSRDGFTSVAFHKLCDNKGPTVMILKIMGTREIIGGYSPLDWTSPSMWKYGTTSDSFLFSFAYGELKNAVLSRTKDKSTAIKCRKSNGPVFGYGPDLCMWSDEYEKKWCCYRCSYEPSIRFADGEFWIDEMEVFAVKQRK